MDQILVWLWPEWYARSKRNSSNLFEDNAIVLFGSGFDKSLWSLVEEIFRFLQENILQLTQDFSFHIVLLPIGRSIVQNHNFKQKVETILKELNSPIMLASHMESQFKSLWDDLALKSAQFYEYAIEHDWEQLPAEEYNYYKDIYLFGPLTARFLLDWKPLPLLYLGSHYFHGVPYGLSFEEMMETYFLPLDESKEAEIVLN